MTTQERRRIANDAAEYVQRVLSAANARTSADHMAHVRDWHHAQATARLLADAAERDDTADDEDENDGYSFSVDERREYGTLWAVNGSVVG